MYCLFCDILDGKKDGHFLYEDGRSFCTNEDYTLRLFINGEQVPDIRDHESVEDDRVLILYGAQTPEEIDAVLLKLENQELIK